MRLKVLISSIMALLPLMGVAQRISDDQAMSIAEAVLGKQVVKAVPSKLLRASAVNVGGKNVKPFYEIFSAEDGRGFVIVSTDRRAPKVIGYGVGKCDPDNLAPQLATLLAAEDSLLNLSTSLEEHPSWPYRQTDRCLLKVRFS